MANTQNYGFSLPQGWNGPGAAERRRDHAAVDKAIRAVADNAATRAQMTAAQNRLSALEGRVEVRIGSYTGSGAEPQTISLGFTPKAVLVESSSGVRSGSTGICNGGLALNGHPITAALEVVSGGFRVTNSDWSSTNAEGRLFKYLVFR